MVLKRKDYVRIRSNLNVDDPEEDITYDMENFEGRLLQINITHNDGDKDIITTYDLSGGNGWSRRHSHFEVATFNDDDDPVEKHLYVAQDYNNRENICLLDERPDEDDYKILEVVTYYV